MMTTYWCVVVRYDDPRGGTWRGVPLPREQAEQQLSVEAARVHGTAWLEQARRP